MNTHIHSSEEIKNLSNNPYVERCTAKSITYTYEFKKKAVEQYHAGIGSKEIWRRAGFDVSTWRKTYTKDCMKDWKNIVKQRGFEGLMETRGKGATGRTKTKGLTDAETIKYLKLQVTYLKAENDFLAKLRAKRAESNSGQNRNTRSSKN